MNIHILSNSPTRVNSGFGIVTRNLSLGLTKLGHNVSVSDMQNIYNKEYWNGITIYPMNSVQSATSDSDFYINELKQLQKNLKDSKADVFIILYPSYDNVVVSNHLHELHENTIWYYPVEGENIPEVYINELLKVKKVIPLTKQGKHELKITSKLNNVCNEIYHGFDPNIFNKIGALENSSSFHYCIWKQRNYMNMQDSKWLCENGCFNCSGCNSDCKNYTEEKIIFNVLGNEFTGNISNFANIKNEFGVETIISFTGENNGSRKKIDRLISSYKMIKNMDKDNEIMLLMHTVPNSNSGIKLYEHIIKHKLLEDKKMAFVYGTDGSGNSFSDAALNILYNISDINISTSSAEGFGMPTLESMACDVCNIGPNFSSFIELIGNDKNIKNNRGLLSDIQGYQKLDNGLKRALVSPKSTADNVMMLHDDKNLMKILSNNAYEWSKQYTWDNISKEFNNLLLNV